jgi:diacylglycerol kinase family enzyme
MCVIFNPAAGRRRARQRLEGLRRDWGERIEFQPTCGPGHAEELAEMATRNGFDIVAAAGGDGTVHEVANGILRAGKPEVRFAVIPLGSANDYAHSLKWGRDHDAWTEKAGDVHVVDVGRVEAPGKEPRYFVCCLGLGLNGAVTLESRRIHRLQGLALYGLATVRALWYHYGCPPMELAFDDQPAYTAPTLMLSLLVGRREGSFVLAPDARLDDGCFDFVHSGALSRCEVLWFLPRLALAGPPDHHPKVRRGRCRRVRLRSKAPLIVHIDGEFFCTPEEKIHELDVGIVPGVLCVQTTFL